MQLSEGYDQALHPEPIYIGGPVENQRGFVMHRPATTNAWEQQLNLNPDLAITTSADILQAMAHGEDVGEYQVVLGYSGWAAGQLEQEMADNSWINVDIPVTRLLALPSEERLQAALDALGIQYSQLGNDAGHA